MTAPHGQRHQARERAILILYEAHQKHLPALEVRKALPVAPDPFVGELLDAVDTFIEEIDRLITEYAYGWSIDRLAVLDLLILRLGIAELLSPDGPPAPVVLDEAVELAGTYSTDRSGAFINGVLASVVAERAGGSVDPGSSL